MKKRILFFALATGAMIVGCSTDYDYIYHISYAYVNKCSTEITVHHTNKYDTMSLDSIFVIPVNGQHILSFSGFGYPRPFLWANDLSRVQEFVTVSNGEKIINQIAADGELFDMDNYTFVKEENRHKTVEFVFTDAFFDNGESLQ